MNPLLASLLLLSFTYVPSRPSQMVDCGSYTREALMCALGGSAWKVKSVTSDLVRVEDGLASFDWSGFWPSDAKYVQLHLSEDLFESRLSWEDAMSQNKEWSELTPSLPAGDTVLMDFTARSGLSVCSIETTDFLRSATVTCSNEYTQYVYGHKMLTELGDLFGMEQEQWYSIEYTHDQITYQVEKHLNGEIYEVTVTLRRVT